MKSKEIPLKITMETRFAGKLQIAIYGVGRLEAIFNKEAPLFVFAAFVYKKIEPVMFQNLPDRSVIYRPSSWELINFLHCKKQNFTTAQVKKLFGPKNMYDFSDHFRGE